MKNIRSVVIVSLFAFAILAVSPASWGSQTRSGTDDQGKPCFIEILDDSPIAVKVNYSSGSVFELTPGAGPRSEQLYGAKRFSTAFVQTDLVVIYSPRDNTLYYGELRSDLRSGEVFFEADRTCYLK